MENIVADSVVKMATDVRNVVTAAIFVYLWFHVLQYTKAPRDIPFDLFVATLLGLLIDGVFHGALAVVERLRGN